MKALKFTLLVVVFSALFTSCVKEDLHEDDQLVDNGQPVQVTVDTGGGIDEE